MARVKSRPFNKRAFVAMMVAISGIGLPVTGVANHIYQFDPLTVARHAWMSAHNVLSVLFIVFTIWHIVMNRRSMLIYIKGIAPQYLGAGREALIAVTIVVIVLILAVSHAFLTG